MESPKMVQLSAMEMPSATAFVSAAPLLKPEPGENLNESRDGADQTDERCDAGDDFEDDQPALEPHQFGARPGLRELDVLRTRPAHVLQAPRA